MVKDISPLEAWAVLKENTKAVLVDVRTEAEWKLVGLPDLSSLGREVVLLSWQFSDGSRNEDFASQLVQSGCPQDAPVLFLCRSGARSLAAARLASENGFSQALNVEGGFEGPCDARRHRGTVAGWKHAGLPWIQS